MKEHNETNLLEPNGKEAELSEGLLTDLLIHSFRLSQGWPELQSYIFQWLHQKFPKWTIGDQIKQETINRATPIAEKIVLKKPDIPFRYKTHSPKDTNGILQKKRNVKLTLEEEIHSMQRIINGDFDKVDINMKDFKDTTYVNDWNSFQNPVPTIMSLMKERDGEFLEKGREFQYFDYYVALKPKQGEVIAGKRSTGVPIYDLMLDDVRKYWLQSLVNKES